MLKGITEKGEMKKIFGKFLEPCEWFIEQLPLFLEVF